MLFDPCMHRSMVSNLYGPHPRWRQNGLVLESFWIRTQTHSRRALAMLKMHACDAHMATWSDVNVDQRAWERPTWLVLALCTMSST